MNLLTNSLPCPACAAPTARGDSELARCLVCDHIWQRNLTITATYDADYVAQRYDTYDTNDAMAMLRLGFVQALQPRSVLDYGFGNGAFIRAAESRIRQPTPSP